LATSIFPFPFFRIVRKDTITISWWRVRCCVNTERVSNNSDVGAQEITGIYQWRRAHWQPLAASL
jgi:hypothetical protein